MSDETPVRLTPERLDELRQLAARSAGFDDGLTQRESFELLAEIDALTAEVAALKRRLAELIGMEPGK